MTRWEIVALGRFLEQVPAGYHVCPQVRIADMLKVTGGDESGRKRAFNRICAKSVDFAITEASTGRVALVVELDDRSHDRADRRERDRLVDSALGSAGIPVAHFRPRQALDIRALLERGRG